MPQQFGFLAQLAERGPPKEGEHSAYTTPHTHKKPTTRSSQEPHNYKNDATERCNISTIKHKQEHTLQQQLQQ